jgi:hypothetical protein
VVVRPYSSAVQVSQGVAVSIAMTWGFGIGAPRLLGRPFAPSARGSGNAVSTASGRMAPNSTTEGDCPRVIVSLQYAESAANSTR